MGMTWDPQLNYKHLHEALWGTVMQSPAYRLPSQVTRLARGRRGALFVLHLNTIING